MLHPTLHPMILKIIHLPVKFPDHVFTTWTLWTSATLPFLALLLNYVKIVKLCQNYLELAKNMLRFRETSEDYILQIAEQCVGIQHTNAPMYDGSRF